MVGFRNNSGLEFIDMSSEESRSYDFGERGNITINNPALLNVSTSGGHRIFDGDGISHYVPSGWIQLSWVAKEGKPHFVK
jgi:hypothetical protein